MRLKLDENVPALLKPIFSALGHDTDTVPDEHLSGAMDNEVFQAAQRTDRFFITCDLDFSDARRFRVGTHAGVMLVRLRDNRAETIVSRLAAVFEREPVETWSGCYVIVRPDRIRVRRPRQ